MYVNIRLDITYGINWLQTLRFIKKSILLICTLYVLWLCLTYTAIKAITKHIPCYKYIILQKW